MGTIVKLRYLLATTLALALLSGCSRHTLITVEVDLLSLLDPGTTSGTFTLATSEFRLPDEDGYHSNELGLPPQVLEGLVGFSADLVATLTSNAASGSEQVTVDLHIVEGDDATPFDTTPVASSTATISPGATQTLDFAVDVNDDVNAWVLELLKTGDFRVAFRLEYVAGPSASGVDYRLDEVDVRMSARTDAFSLF
jgi:hypothetical protein